MSQTNMVVVEGRITKVFPGRSEKAPTMYTVENVQEWNGKETKRYVEFITFPSCKTFSNIKEGNIVKVIGTISVQKFEKDGQVTYKTQVVANSVELQEGTRAEKPEIIPVPEPEDVEGPEDVDFNSTGIEEDEIPF